MRAHQSRLPFIYNVCESRGAVHVYPDFPVSHSVCCLAGRTAPFPATKPISSGIEISAFQIARKRIKAYAGSVQWDNDKSRDASENGSLWAK
jgi:hypothetical protein